MAFWGKAQNHLTNSEENGTMRSNGERKRTRRYRRIEPMKKPLILMIALLVSLPAFAEGSLISAGIDLGYGLSFTYDYVPARLLYEATLNHVLAGVYFDLTYVRLSAAYFTNIANPITVSSTSSTFRLSYLCFGLLAKYPLFIQSFKLWSGIGLKFIHCLILDTNNDGLDDRPSDQAYDDFLLTIAGGAEFKLFKVITIGPGIAIDYNLTPNRFANEPSGSDHTSIVFEFTLSMGIAF
jgi:hypothetical protein